ncbi:hypothetical protein ZIOFF_049500 [Zingiber officinale]|uniref:Non-specific lipid-transfer protein n=1 Tax=Zingiber officinale TaxID=94328 RepID=A0A8J5FT09_ZINOF|nr:hypothetical protein ZIOFF_049500 [Zingiber officinale]
MTRSVQSRSTEQKTRSAEQSRQSNRFAPTSGCALRLIWEVCFPGYHGLTVNSTKHRRSRRTEWYPNATVGNLPNRSCTTEKGNEEERFCLFLLCYLRNLLPESFTPCTSYVTGQGPSVPVPVPCCDGVKSMAGMMTTRPDRVAACTCFQAAAAKMQGIEYGRVITLPGHCNVDVMFDFTPDVHCDT